MIPLKTSLIKSFQASKPFLELDWKKLTLIVGPSYDKISEKAHKEKNSEWKNHLVPVLDQKGNIIWVKNKFEVNISDCSLFPFCILNVISYGRRNSRVREKGRRTQHF